MLCCSWIESNGIWVDIYRTLGAYVTAINHQRKKKTDNETIGLLICKTKDNIVAEYALESSTHPIGISEYNLKNLLPKNYRSTLPSIDEIEKSMKKQLKNCI